MHDLVFFHNSLKKGAYMPIFAIFVIILFRGVPIFLAIYLGKDLVDWLLAAIPEKATHIISVLGGVLPAVGIAMLMGIVIKNKSHLIFFFTGFVLLAFAKLSMIAIVFLAALVAYMYFLTLGKTETVSNASEKLDKYIEENDFIEQRDLF